MASEVQPALLAVYGHGRRRDAQRQEVDGVVLSHQEVTEPKVVVVVLINEPSGDLYHGGEVAAPVFSRVMQGALRVLNIAPDANDTVASNNELLIIKHDQKTAVRVANDV